IAYDPEPVAQLGGRGWRASPLPALATGLALGIVLDSAASPAADAPVVLPLLAVVAMAVAWIAAPTTLRGRMGVVLGFGVALGILLSGLHTRISPPLHPDSGVAAIRIAGPIAIDTTGRRAATVEVQSFGPAHD